MEADADGLGSAATGRRHADVCPRERRRRRITRSGVIRVTITPHIAAITLPQQAMDQIVANIRALEVACPGRRGRQAAGY